MTLKPNDIDELLLDLPQDDGEILDESIYDEVENYYGDDLLDLVQG